MKKLLMLMVLITTISIQAQEPLGIVTNTDEFTGKVTYNVDQGCTIEKTGEEGMILLPNLSSLNKVNFLGAVTVGIGCLDNAQIFILFENGDVINKFMSNDFNCEGIAIFKLSKKDWEKMATERIDKVKIANRGKYVAGIPDNPEYFIQLGALLNN